MADPLTCPSCGRPLREREGGRCPACGAAVPPVPPPGLGLRVVVVEDDKPGGSFPLPPPPLPLQPVLLSSTVEEGAPVPRVRPCPACGARIDERARRCPHCREDLFEGDEFRPWERPEAPPRRDLESHRGPLILALGVISLVFSLPALCGFAFLPFGVPGLISVPLGLAAWLLGKTDQDKMAKKIMDPEGLRSTETGKSCGLVGAILGALAVALCGVIHLGKMAAGLP